MKVSDSLVFLDPRFESKFAWRDTKDYTWGELRDLCCSATTYLLELGVKPQDRVANLGCNSLAWVMLDLACSVLNAIHVPLDPRMGQQQRSDCLSLLDPKIVFEDGAYKGETTSRCSYRSLESLIQQQSNTNCDDLRTLCVPAKADDVANILFTSGTTGAQRGVMLSHRNLVLNAQAKLDAMPQLPSDHRLNFLPFSHAYARTCELTTWLLSYSSMEVMHGIEAVLQNAKEAAPSLINGVPLFYDRLSRVWSQQEPTLDSLHQILGDRIRRLASGGAALNAKLRADFQGVGLPVFQGYGLTEASPVVCSNRVLCSSDKSDATWECLDEVGPVVQGTQIRIDANSKLWVAGDGVMLGYWRDDTATRNKIIDGWLDTGDLAELVLRPEEDGNCLPESASETTPCVRILGRDDDTIVLSSGYKIFPLELEQRLKTISWIEQCLLVGDKRPFPILLCVGSRERLSGSVNRHKEGLLREVHEALAGVANYALPRDILVQEEAWTSVARLANFKGGLMRKRIEQRYALEIEAIYQKELSKR